MKRFLVFLIFIGFFQTAYSQNAGKAGAFARMGFGARGMAMGNALTAVTAGDIYAYYNPALSCFSKSRVASLSYGFLSLDRSLNFLSYTQSIQPTAGISATIINSGVSNIDGRNSNGVHTEFYSTYDYQFSLAFSNRVSQDVAIGVAVKLYHNKIFEEVKSTTVGFDVGINIRITDEIYAAGVLQDLGSKYIWDTKPIYPDPLGKSTKDKFPILQKIGLAYILPNPQIVIDIDFEKSNENTSILRGGAEYTITENFTIRAGIDRIELGDYTTGVKPSFGFTAQKSIGDFSPSFSYAYIYESFAPRGIHLLTLSSNL
ncbi:MAG: hypothetical protein HY964_10410 [Ignavibacteriales bacterium]|nr:hypothetical protein [Ignavibacteriales bacterium]